MEWKKIDENIPHYDWIILGYINENDNMIWQIGRTLDGKNFEFMDKEIEFGVCCGDATWEFLPQQVTHYLILPYDE